MEDCKMKLTNINCPNCGGTINADISKQKIIFCTYCGQHLEVDNGVRETVHTKNVNINKSVSIHKRYTNDADILREENKIKQLKHENRVGCLCIGLILLVFLGIFIMSSPETVGKLTGKISAGYHSDLEGENYRYVKSTLEAAGFTNIELIDLNDQGLFKKDGEVTSVSVGGNTSFDSWDFFEKNAKIVITYH